MIKLALVAFLLQFSLIKCQYTKLQWSLCHTAAQTPAFTLQSFDMTPMPITHPGPLQIFYQINLHRGLQGTIKADTTILRTVAGLTLPFRCFVMSNDFFGSCNYADACVAWNHFLYITFGGATKVQCPFDTLPQQIDTITSVDLPDLSTTELNLFASGNFDVKITLNDSNGFFGCINMKFSLKKAV